MFPQTLRLLTEISSAGEWLGSSKQLRQGQTSKFPHREAKSLFHLSALFEKKVNSVIICFL